MSVLLPDFGIKRQKKKKITILKCKDMGARQNGVKLLV
jgi:hypothetical protein